MEIWRLVGHPVEKAANGQMCAQSCGIGKGAGQIGVGKSGMNGAMADRVDWHDLSPAPALGHGMVPFDAQPQGAGAQPTASGIIHGAVDPSPLSSSLSPSLWPIAFTR